jgi:hypothetical protein
MAFGVYFAGTLAALSVLVNGLGTGLFTGLENVMLAVALWWITAGIGIRLCVFPVDFFKSLLGRS